jgi:serine/threonine-protein kinase HipA
MSRCLYCYQPLPTTAHTYHPACSRKLFGKPTPPAFPYSEAQLLALAEQIVRSHITVTGVQPKLAHLGHHWRSRAAYPLYHRGRAGGLYP